MLVAIGMLRTCLSLFYSELQISKMYELALLDINSARTPDLSTIFNAADVIKRQIREDGHQKWGFVIYRYTYTSDEDWKVFMERLRYRIRNTLERCNGLELMDSLCLTVLEDEANLANSSTAVIREHFKQWSSIAPQEEQAGPRPLAAL